MKNLKLPLDLRKELAKPLGKLIFGNRVNTINEIAAFLKKEIDANNAVDRRLYCVGDIVTYDFLNDSFLRNYIKICFVDEKTKRQEQEEIKFSFTEIFDKFIELKNPAGTISSEIWPILEYILNENLKVLITIVEGEEDLLVIPLISELSLKPNIKHYVFYGQPPITDAEKSIPEGIVMVEVNEKIKERVSEIIELMDEY